MPAISVGVGLVSSFPCFKLAQENAKAKVPSLPGSQTEAEKQNRVDLKLPPDLTAVMRQLFALALILVLAASGCARGKGKSRQNLSRQKFNPAVVVTPETGLAGKVVRVNPSARFTVLNFPVGRLPSLDQRLSVYRGGLKVGEIKVTGPQLDDNVVGDIIAGEAQPGDDVRDR